VAGTEASALPNAARTEFPRVGTEELVYALEGFLVLGAGVGEDAVVLDGAVGPRGLCCQLDVDRQGHDCLVYFVTWTGRETVSGTSLWSPTDD
jgi:hypothetical protein